VNGFIQPGNKVSLIVNFDRKFVDRAGQSVDARLDGPFAHYLLQNVDVLAVGTRVVAVAAQPANGQPAAAAETACCILTLAVTPGQAEQLVWAINNTQPYFALLPQDSPVTKVPGRTASNLFN
jgi:Flp pilus assembly protein CpaB